MLLEGVSLPGTRLLSPEPSSDHGASEPVLTGRNARGAAQAGPGSSRRDLSLTVEQLAWRDTHSNTKKLIRVDERLCLGRLPLIVLTEAAHLCGATADGTPPDTRP